MKGGRHFELLAPGPKRVIIVFAIETESVQPECLLRRTGMFPGNGRDRTANITGTNDHLQTQVVHRMLKLLDCFAGRVNWDNRRRRQAIGILAICFSVVTVESSAGTEP